MNKENLLRFRNETASYAQCYNVKRNVVNLNSHNSEKHEMIKCRICYELKKQGIHFITEATMIRDKNKGCIADILILDTAEVIEILVSETEEKARIKVQKYPDCLEVLSVTDSKEYFTGNYKILKRKMI